MVDTWAVAINSQSVYHFIKSWPIAKSINDLLKRKNLVSFNTLVTYFSFFLQVFYLPLALVIPPTQFVMHHQFSYLYMFWIHTEAIKSLGPLEYILNTPSHHRVHHG